MMEDTNPNLGAKESETEEVKARGRQQEGAAGDPADVAAVPGKRGRKEAGTLPLKNEDEMNHL